MYLIEILHAVYIILHTQFMQFCSNLPAFWFKQIVLVKYVIYLWLSRIYLHPHGREQIGYQRAYMVAQISP